MAGNTSRLQINRKGGLTTLASTQKMRETATDLEPCLKPQKMVNSGAERRATHDTGH